MSEPITAEQYVTAIHDVSDKQIEDSKAQLHTSITRMILTNLELLDELYAIGLKLDNVLNNAEAASDLEEDRALYQETVDENNKTIEAQQFRITLALTELVRRGLTSEALKTDEETKLQQEIQRYRQRAAVDRLKSQESLVAGQQDKQPEGVYL